MYSHDLIRSRSDFFLLLTGRWQLNLPFQTHTRRWKIFVSFIWGLCYMKKIITYVLKGLPCESMVYSQEILFLLCFITPERTTNMPNLVRNAQIEAKLSGLLCLFWLMMLCSETCSVLGRGDARAAVEWTCWLYHHRKGHTPVHPLLTPLPPPALAVPCRTWAFLSHAALGAEGEAQPLATWDGDGQFSTSALASEQTLPDWATREWQGRFTSLPLHWRKQTHTGLTETQECFLACLKLGSLSIFY